LAAIRRDATFALITPPDLSDAELAEAVDRWPTPVDVLGPVDAADVVDVVARAELVVGNDTGLTHLAALTDRPDGTGPQVLGLYSRHAHTKWSTGRARHHALATPFSAMLAQADRCPVRDELDDTVWGRAAEITAIAPDVVAYAAASLAGWRR
jgi:ADP-heptose:LPS heptosyltransferase